jgi:hypothetical protein
MAVLVGGARAGPRWGATRRCVQHIAESFCRMNGGLPIPLAGWWLGWPGGDARRRQWLESGAGTGHWQASG